MVKPKDYKFYLVHFTQEKGVFDIAYRDWIHYDEKKEVFFCKYHAGRDGQLAQKLMKDFKPAPKEWESYPVEIRGGADTWDLVLDRLEKLNDDPYAFSTSNEGFAEQQIEELKKKLKFKRINYNNEEINSMFSQVGGSLNDAESDKGKSTAFEISSGETNKENDVRKKKQYQKIKKTLKVSSSDSSPEAYQKKRSIKKKKEFFDHPGTGHSEVYGTRTIPRDKTRSSSEPQEKSAHYSKKQQQISQPSTLRTADKTTPDDDSSEASSPKQREVPKKSTPKRKELVSTTPLGRPPHTRNIAMSMTVPRSKSSFNFSDRLTTPQRDSDESVDVRKYLRNLTSALGQMQGLLVQVHDDQQEIKALLAANRNVPGVYQPSIKLEDHYCEDIKKFHEFNTKLEEGDFREKICTAMLSKLNCQKSLSKNIGYILKPLISKDVLLNYVSRKKTKDKFIFSELPIWPCITDAIQRETKNNKMAEYKEADLIQALGGTINNCRSWGKGNKIEDGRQGQDPEDAPSNGGQ